VVPVAVFGEPGFRQRTAVPTKNSIGTKIWVVPPENDIRDDAPVGVW
jgi:hypothetical protein